MKSLPYDAPIECLRRLMIENDEPVLLNVGSRGPTGLCEKLGPLEIVDSYDEKYIVAYSIIEGTSPVETVMPQPLVN